MSHAISIVKNNCRMLTEFDINVNNKITRFQTFKSWIDFLNISLSLFNVNSAFLKDTRGLIRHILD